MGRRYTMWVLSRMDEEKYVTHTNAHGWQFTEHLEYATRFITQAQARYVARTQYTGWVLMPLRLSRNATGGIHEDA